MVKHGVYLSISVAAWLVAASFAHATLRDARIDGAKQCTAQFAVNERQQGIPSHTLAAIANTESGRWNDTLGMVLPWPWTINAEGKGFYFESKAAAIRKVRALQATGMKSIDIGCMQVNLRHHPDAFANLEQAFDPRSNIAYAAKFLRRNYDDLGDWSKAVAAYHSRTPKYGNKYKARVQKAMDTITGKVRTARSAVQSLTQRDDAPDSPSYRIIQLSEPKQRKSVRSIRPQQSGMQLAMRDAPQQAAQGIALRPIDRLTSVPNVAVAKPQYKRISLSGSQAAARESTLVQPQTADSVASSGRISLDPPKRSSGSKAKFIFVD
jgi:hypothetical protein